MAATTTESAQAPAVPAPRPPAPPDGLPQRLDLARTPEGSLALLTNSLMSPVRQIVDGGAIVSLLTGGLLLIVFTMVHREPLGEYITAICVGGSLVTIGGIFAWGAHQANAKERLASIGANKEIRIAAIAATKDLGNTPIPDPPLPPAQHPGGHL